MPFAGYKDFDECVAKNKDKSNPKGYCASIMRKVEGKNLDEALIEIEKARSVGGYESPEPGDLPEKGKRMLAEVYASCRKDGGSKESCSKQAWAAVKRAGYKSDEVDLMKESELLFGGNMGTSEAFFVVPLQKNFEIKKNADGSEVKILHGEASNTNLDSDKDFMFPECINQMAKDAGEGRINLFGDHNHSWKNILAKLNGKVENNRFVPDLILASPTANPDVTRFEAYVNDEFNLGLSVGLSEVQFASSDEVSDMGRTGRGIKMARLKEVSVVGIPANENTWVGKSIAEQIYKSYKGGRSMEKDAEPEGKPPEEPPKEEPPKEPPAEPKAPEEPEKPPEEKKEPEAPKEPKAAEPPKPAEGEGEKSSDVTIEKRIGQMLTKRISEDPGLKKVFDDLVVKKAEEMVEKKLKEIPLSKSIAPTYDDIKKLATTNSETPAQDLLKEFKPGQPIPPELVYLAEIEKSMKKAK